jgi:hypothetical protein
MPQQTAEKKVARAFVEDVPETPKQSFSISDVYLLRMLTPSGRAESFAEAIQIAAENPHHPLLGKIAGGKEKRNGSLNSIVRNISNFIEDARFAEHIDITQSSDRIKFLEKCGVDLLNSVSVGVLPKMAKDGVVLRSEQFSVLPQDLSLFYLLVEKLSQLETEKPTFGIDPSFEKSAKELASQLFSRSNKDTRTHDVPLTIDGKFRIGFEVIDEEVIISVSMVDTDGKFNNAKKIEESRQEAQSRKQRAERSLITILKDIEDPRECAIRSQEFIASWATLNSLEEAHAVLDALHAKNFVYKDITTGESEGSFEVKWRGKRFSIVPLDITSLEPDSQQKFSFRISIDADFYRLARVEAERELESLVKNFIQQRMEQATSSWPLNIESIKNDHEATKTAIRNGFSKEKWNRALTECLQEIIPPHIRQWKEQKLNPHQEGLVEQPAETQFADYANNKIWHLERTENRDGRPDYLITVWSFE